MTEATTRYTLKKTLLGYKDEAMKKKTILDRIKEEVESLSEKLSDLFQPAPAPVPVRAKNKRRS